MQSLEIPEQMAESTGDRTFTIGLPGVAAPVKKGSISVWLSFHRNGLPISGALCKTLLVRSGEFTNPQFYTQDVVNVLPRSGKVWFVAAYGPTLLATGAVRIPT